MKHVVTERCCTGTLEECRLQDQPTCTSSARLEAFRKWEEKLSPSFSKSGFSQELSAVCASGSGHDLAISSAGQDLGRCKGVTTLGDTVDLIQRV